MAISLPHFCGAEKVMIRKNLCADFPMYGKGGETGLIVNIGSITCGSAGKLAELLFAGEAGGGEAGLGEAGLAPTCGWRCSGRCRGAGSGR